MKTRRIWVVEEKQYGEWTFTGIAETTRDRARDEGKLLRASSLSAYPVRVVPYFPKED